MTVTGKADVELGLVHDGRHWIGRNTELEAKGATLQALDDDVKRLLQRSGHYQKGDRVIVFMGFDFDTIPTWLRQYHSHYFNRYVTIDL